MIPWILGLLAFLVIGHLIVGFLRACAVIYFAEGEVSSAKEIFAAEMLFWSVAEVRQWRHRRQQRRDLIRDIGHI
jgi:hypothetical protein